MTSLVESLHLTGNRTNEKAGSLDYFPSVSKPEVENRFDFSDSCLIVIPTKLRRGYTVA